MKGILMTCDYWKLMLIGLLLMSTRVHSSLVAQAQEKAPSSLIELWVSRLALLWADLDQMRTVASEFVAAAVVVQLELGFPN